jgi:hypothetical protein
MPPKNVILRSAPLKVPVKAALVQAKKAIAQGEKAVKKSEAAVKADPRNKQKRSQLKKNRDLLAKAEFVKSGLESSEKLANFMCPLQLANLEFDYV